MGGLWQLRVVGLVLVAACRLGFDDSPATDGQDHDASGGDATSIDASGTATDARPPDAASGLVYWTFGEDSTADRPGRTRDTYLSNELGEAGLNFGDDNRLRLRRGPDQNGLIAFNLAGEPIPAGTVVGLRLELEVIEVEDVGASIEVREQTQAWDEGSLDGAPGAANWTQATASTSWTTAGAVPAGASLGSLAVGQLGRAGLDLPIDLLTRWRSSNHGLWLRVTVGEESRVGSREGPDGTRPRLVVVIQP